MTTTNTTILYTHPSGISAPDQAWAMLDASLSREPDGSRGYARVGFGLEPLMRLGVVETGDSGERAIAWVAREHQRRQEERTRVTAQAREAEAVAALARAITDMGDAAALERILARVSERTAHAIRRQMGGAS